MSLRVPCGGHGRCRGAIAIGIGLELRHVRAGISEVTRASEAGADRLPLG